MEYIANLTDGSRIYVQGETLPHSMKILNEDFPECSEMVVSWLGPTGITFQMHDKNMRFER